MHYSNFRPVIFATRAIISIPRRRQRQLFATAARTTTTTTIMDYQKILQGKYPAKEHTRRVVDYIRTKIPDATNGVLYLEGRMTKLLEDNDEPEPFRQRRFFYYLSGCGLADCHLVHDIATSKTTLFIPPIDPDSVVWSGLPVSPAEALSRYDVDEVKYTTDVNATLARLGAATATTVFAIPGQVSDHVTFLEFGNKDFNVLKPAIERCRVVKSTYELALIAKANAVTAAAHRAVLARVRTAPDECTLDAAFLASCVAAGARNQAYHPIVAGGTAAATLHYVNNDAPLAGKLNLLLDAGAEWDCYAADVTRTFPVGGRFSPESRAIYDIVLRMQHACIDALHTGVRWEDVHLLAHRIAAEGLLALGILKKSAATTADAVDEVVRNRTTVAFFPHGLGHYLGMDTHDTGGDANYADPDPMFRYLRVRGTLPAGSVITVEPGVYFCRFIIEPYLKDPAHSRYIDADVLEKYWEVGGVRIEDNVVITDAGCDNLTTAVKSVEEMERIIIEGQA